MPAVVPPLLRGLPPVLPARARVLVLGSMPGSASLAARQYYAHPRNAFWPVLGGLLGFDPALPYARRLRALARAGIALWDVVGACRRRGSLDAGIDPASIALNDIAGLVGACRSLEVVATNGGTAGRLYRRHVAAMLPRPLVHLALPSTSPAHAGMNLAAKQMAWAAALAPWVAGRGPSQKCDPLHVSDAEA